MDCHTEILITDLIPTVIPENKKTCLKLGKQAEEQVYLK